MNCIICIVSCNFVVHATCSLTLMTYKYDKLQVVRPIVKLLFLIMSMLLGQPWLCNAHVIHHWENNPITIKGNGMVRTIDVTKHLDNNTKDPKVLCYDLMEGVIEEK